MLDITFFNLSSLNASPEITSDWISLKVITFWQPKPNAKQAEVWSPVTSLTPSIWTRALVVLCQSWPPPRAPLSEGRSWKPSPVSGLHNWTMGNPDTPSSKGTALDYCRRCWLFHLLSSHWCVCGGGGKPICFFNEKKNTEGNTARERRGQKMEGLNDEVTWREVRSFQMGLQSHTHTHTHQLHCLRPYSTYTIQGRILLHHAVFSLCGLKLAELTKAKLKDFWSWQAQKFLCKSVIKQWINSRNTEDISQINWSQIKLSTGAHVNVQ